VLLLELGLGLVLERLVLVLVPVLELVQRGQELGCPEQALLGSGVGCIDCSMIGPRTGSKFLRELQGGTLHQARLPQYFGSKASISCSKSPFDVYNKWTPPRSLDKPHHSRSPDPPPHNCARFHTDYSKSAPPNGSK